MVPLEERFPRPSVMGVVNVTPDSFSDGGVNFEADDAVAAALRMAEEGAAIVDVGGESTRPGSDGVSLDEELRRVVPVLEALQGRVPVSIDTAKAEVARRALALGVELVNDVTALRGDPELAEVVASSGAYLCLMHMQGEPRTMQHDPTYEDVAGEVAAFLEQRLRFAVDAGVPEEGICLDPGFGFGKSVEQNFELLRRLGEIVALGRPVLVGLSRKRSLGRILGDPEATAGPLSASLAAAVEAYERGAAIFRAHDVREHIEALTVASAVADAISGSAASGPRSRALPGVSGPARDARRMIVVELDSLEVFGRHGVLDEERRDGQAFFFDVRLEVGDGALSDRIEDAVDYREVADCVRKVSDGRQFNLIEALAAAVADALVGRFEVERVRVRVRKPQPGGVPAAHSAATVERSSSS